MMRWFLYGLVGGTVGMAFDLPPLPLIVVLAAASLPPIITRAIESERSP